MIVGIDVSKQALEVAYGDGKDAVVEHVPYTEADVTALVHRLQSLQPQQIVVEATGGLERRLVEACRWAKLPILQVQPAKVRALAMAEGRRAKTDRSDARLLAHYGRLVCSQPSPTPTPQQQKLKDLLRRRQQLEDIRTAERNRLGTASPHVRNHIQRHLKWLEEEIKNLEAEMESVLREQTSLWRQYQLLLSVPGIGPLTAIAFLSHIPAPTAYSAKQLASFVGLAPHPRQSGTKDKKRHIIGGCQEVRNILYMATLNATRFNPVIRTFYQRLRQAGKPAKVALVAAMRKLLTILHAILKHDTPWNTALHTSTP
ncbi:MAG: IS110 family transposase [Caldilineales bacterium]|nr:IS110 family transposase [Caldilineales bacterium]